MLSVNWESIIDFLYMMCLPFFPFVLYLCIRPSARPKGSASYDTTSFSTSTFFDLFGRTRVDVVIGRIEVIYPAID